MPPGNKPMSIWEKISKLIASLTKRGEQLSNIFLRLKTHQEKTLGFTIAVIALSAKMAKADGVVKPEEIAAFKQVFHIPKNEEKNASHVFNLARRDVAGFEIYAQKIYKMLSGNSKILEDLLEGLLHIATSDGSYHPAENIFINKVARIFKLNEMTLVTLKSRYVPDQVPNPFIVLGVKPSWDILDIKKKWKELVRENHPDRLSARGLPAEAISLANSRLLKINQAWEIINESTKSN